MEYEPRGGWEGISSKSPKVFRFAKWASDRIAELETERAKLISELQNREFHRSWCNGGYEGGRCTCDFEQRQQVWENIR